MAHQSYAIGAGHNVALVSLTNIESIKPTGDVYYFFTPRAYKHSSPGVRRGRGNGLGFRSGYLKVDWIFDAMTFIQYEYLKSTYCSGGLEGLVTIYSRAGSLTYVRYNAVMSVPEPEATQGDFAYFEIPIHFTHLVAA